MNPRVAAAINGRQPLLQCAIVPKRVLDRGHSRRRQRLVEKAFQLGACEVNWHCLLHTIPETHLHSAAAFSPRTAAGR
jgi:hypothetical protein